MIRNLALGAALAAAAFDLAGAWTAHRYGTTRITLPRAGIVTALALAPCGIAFLQTVARHLRTPRAGRVRLFAQLPIRVPRAYVGAAVLGMIGTLTAMGERFGPYVLLAGIALVALALSQARPRRA